MKVMESLPDSNEHNLVSLLTNNVEKPNRSPKRASSISYFKHHKASVECLEEGARKWKRFSTPHS